MIKVINFSTFIDVLNISKTTVKHSICKLYNMLDTNNLPNVKLLIGSLHWLRKIRNSCAHNERIYCINQSQNSRNNNSGRIKETYLLSLRQTYIKSTDKRIFDLLIYFKYYLPSTEYTTMISELQDMLLKLQEAISKNAFDNIRGQMGIKDLTDLEILKNLPKNPIDYKNFDTLQ